jgi:hypothetical protein
MRVYSMERRRPDSVTLHCRVDLRTLKAIDKARSEDNLTRSAWLKVAIDDRLTLLVLDFGPDGEKD